MLRKLGIMADLRTGSLASVFDIHPFTVEHCPGLANLPGTLLCFIWALSCGKQKKMIPPSFALNVRSRVCDTQANAQLKFRM